MPSAPRIASLRTRVGQRMLALFVACALLPTVALTVVSYRHVTRQLLDESAARLRGASKTAGMEIMLHLQGTRGALQQFGDVVAAGGAPEALEAGILGVGRSVGPEFRLLKGAMRRPPVLPPLQSRHVASGRTALVVDTTASALRLLLVRRLGADASSPALLWAEVDPAFIWSSGGAGSLMTEDQDLCVLDSGLRPLACTRPIPAEVVRQAATGRAGAFEWEGAAGRLLSGHFTLFLGFDYGAPSWTAIVTEARSEVLAPLAGFRQSFVAVVILTLAMVFLLSHLQIRRSLTPLEQLTRGTQRLAAEDFSEPVVVPGQDEFSQLAASFNGMAAQIQAQFAALRALHEFDRAALSALDRGGVVQAALAAVGGAVGAGTAALALPIPDHPSSWTVVRQGAAAIDGREVGVDPEWRARLEAGDGALVLRPEAPGAGTLLGVLGAEGPAIALPLRHDGRLAAVMLLQVPGALLEGRQLALAQQLADQVALALSRTDAVEGLRALNRGTLIALARAIEANSPWTAGHSERVSGLAQLLGQALALPAEEINRLEVGGLVHDVGKIGVPVSALNKPGPLTPDEFESVRAHTTIGAGILAPVGAFRELLPLVRSHHELLDGSGYPDGLQGDQIPALVRILTVADIFDALVSDRPYRGALPLQEALALLRREARRRIDAKVAGAFFRLIAAGHQGLWSIYPRLEPQLEEGIVGLEGFMRTGDWT